MRFRILLCYFCLSAHSLNAAVTFDSAFEKGSASQSSPFSFVSNAGTVAGTVGSNSNRILIGYVAFRSASPPTAVAMTWNSVSMTQINSVESGLFTILLFGLISPTTGNQTISCSWTGGTIQVVLGAISVYSADQSTGWSNANTNTGTSTSMTVAITTASGDMAVGGAMDNNSSSATITAGTSDWNERAFDGNYQGAHNAASGSSTNLSWTLGTSKAWGVAGVRVLQQQQIGTPTLLTLGVR